MCSLELRDELQYWRIIFKKREMEEKFQEQEISTRSNRNVILVVFLFGYALVLMAIEIFIVEKSNKPFKFYQYYTTSLVISVCYLIINNTWPQLYTYYHWIYVYAFSVNVCWSIYDTDFTHFEDKHTFTYGFVAAYLISGQIDGGTFIPKVILNTILCMMYISSDLLSAGTLQAKNLVRALVPLGLFALKIRHEEFIKRGIFLEKFKLEDMMSIIHNQIQTPFIIAKLNKKESTIDFHKGNIQAHKQLGIYNQTTYEEFMENSYLIKQFDTTTTTITSMHNTNLNPSSNSSIAQLLPPLLPQAQPNTNHNSHYPTLKLEEGKTIKLPNTAYLDHPCQDQSVVTYESVNSLKCLIRRKVEVLLKRSDQTNQPTSSTKPKAATNAAQAAAAAAVPASKEVSPSIPQPCELRKVSSCTAPPQIVSGYTEQITFGGFDSKRQKQMHKNSPQLISQKTPTPHKQQPEITPLTRNQTPPIGKAVILIEEEELTQRIQESVDPIADEEQIHSQQPKSNFPQALHKIQQQQQQQHKQAPQKEKKQTPNRMPQTPHSNFSNDYLNAPEFLPEEIVEDNLLSDSDFDNEQSDFDAFSEKRSQNFKSPSDYQLIRSSQFLLNSPPNIHNLPSQNQGTPALSTAKTTVPVPNTKQLSYPFPLSIRRSSFSSQSQTNRNRSSSTSESSFKQTFPHQSQQQQQQQLQQSQQESQSQHHHSIKFLGSIDRPPMRSPNFSSIPFYQSAQNIIRQASSSLFSNTNFFSSNSNTLPPPAPDENRTYFNNISTNKNYPNNTAINTQSNHTFQPNKSKGLAAAHTDLNVCKNPNKKTGGQKQQQQLSEEGYLEEKIEVEHNLRNNSSTVPSRYSVRYRFIQTNEIFVVLVVENESYKKKYKHEKLKNSLLSNIRSHQHQLIRRNLNKINALLTNISLPQHLLHPHAHTFSNQNSQSLASSSSQSLGSAVQLHASSQSPSSKLQQSQSQHATPFISPSIPPATLIRHQAALTELLACLLSMNVLHHTFMLFNQFLLKSQRIHIPTCSDHTSLINVTYLLRSITSSLSCEAKLTEKITLSSTPAATAATAPTISITSNEFLLKILLYSILRYFTQHVHPSNSKLFVTVDELPSESAGNARNSNDAANSEDEDGEDVENGACNSRKVNECIRISVKLPYCQDLLNILEASDLFFFSFEALLKDELSGQLPRQSAWILRTSSQIISQLGPFAKLNIEKDINDSMIVSFLLYKDLKILQVPPRKVDQQNYPQPQQQQQQKLHPVLIKPSTKSLANSFV